MELSDLRVAPTSTRDVWRSVSATCGVPSVTECGIQQMPPLHANSLATQKIVSSLQLNSGRSLEVSTLCRVDNIMAMHSYTFLKQKASKFERLTCAWTSQNMACIFVWICARFMTTLTFSCPWVMRVMYIANIAEMQNTIDSYKWASWYTNITMRLK